MGVFSTILIFIAVLAVLVLVHEAGHFFAAKKFGVKVDEFGFGFPPRIVGKTMKGTLYSLNWIPLGGFVKIKGVAGDDPDADAENPDADSFAALSYFKRFTILFAGIFMNILLAMALLWIVFMAGVQTSPEATFEGAILSNEQVAVISVAAESPSEKAGLQFGDIITAINGESIESYEQVQSLLGSAEGETVDLVLDRDGEQQTIQVIPEPREVQGETYVGIGVGLQELVTAKYPMHTAAYLAATSTFTMLGRIFASLFELFTALFTAAPVVEDLAGPVGIASLTGEIAQAGLIPLMQFMSILSINLAVFNLLPIPALDGGRILFLLIEAVRKKPVNQKTEAVIHNIGFLLLITLIIAVTIKDIGSL